MLLLIMLLTHFKMLCIYTISSCVVIYKFYVANYYFQKNRTLKDLILKHNMN